MITTAVWDDLVATALVGTERRPPGPALAEAVQAAFGDIPADAGPEHLVLVAAALAGAERRAGVPTVRVGAGPAAPAPPDARPEAPAVAAQLLGLVLDGHVPVLGGTLPLLAHWVARCAATGYRPPPALVPALLDAATRTPSVRATTAVAGGPLAAWLAARNPVWDWAVPSAPDPGAAGSPDDDDGRSEAWRTGERAERFAVLRELRATDPDRARVLVESTWRTEVVTDRAQIVDTVAVGLAPADEPFLEAALDDRSRSVREAAARVLGGLVGSALTSRMAERLRPLVTVARDGGLAVALPEAVDAAARRDGVIDAGAPPKIGRRAWWLIQLVANAPLGWWTDVTRHPPAALVALPVAPELHEGWVRAALRQGDAEWAGELFAGQPDPRLLAALDHAAADTAVAAALAGRPDAAVAPLLGAVAAPWSPELSAAALERVRAIRAPAVALPPLTTLAERGDPAVAPELDAWIDQQGDRDPRRRPARLAAQALAIRQAITEALP